MEFLHGENDKRTILAVPADISEWRLFGEMLGNDYNLVLADADAGGTSIIEQYCTEVSAFLIDVEVAAADDYAVLELIAREGLFDTPPVLAAATRPITKEDMKLLGHGVSDFLIIPCLRELAVNRIETAIHSKSAKTFYEIEKILSVLPSNIFLKDARGRYMFSTKIMGHLDTGDDPNWTIYGKTDLEVRKDKDNAVKAMEADRAIIESGEGTNYIIEENTAGKQEFLELIKRPVKDDAGNVTGIIAIVNDVTEAENLRRQLSKSAHTDELTGLGNHRAFDEAIAEFDGGDFYPVAVIAADCDGLKIINDTFGHAVGDEYIRMAAAVFKANMPEDARIFNYIYPSWEKDDFIAWAHKEEHSSFIPLWEIDQDFVNLACTSDDIDSIRAAFEDAIEE